jgi:hypothetical protein
MVCPDKASSTILYTCQLIVSFHLAFVSMFAVSTTQPQSRTKGGGGVFVFVFVAIPALWISL